MEQSQKRIEELERIAEEQASQIAAMRRQLVRAQTAHSDADGMEAARRASAYSRSLIEASLDPLVTISPSGQITDVNSATEIVTGIPRLSLIGSDFSTYFTEPEEARKGYLQAFKEGQVRDYPLAIRHSDGHITHVLYNATVYKDEDGEVQGVFAAARDITESRKIEAAMARALRAAEAGTQAKESFLANMR